MDWKYLEDIPNLTVTVIEGSVWISYDGKTAIVEDTEDNYLNMLEMLNLIEKPVEDIFRKINRFTLKK